LDIAALHRSRSAFPYLTPLTAQLAAPGDSEMHKSQFLQMAQIWLVSVACERTLLSNHGMGHRAEECGITRQTIDIAF